jgi:hypothetical protein
LTVPSIQSPPGRFTKPTASTSLEALGTFSIKQYTFSILHTITHPPSTGIKKDHPEDGLLDKSLNP